MLQNRVDPRGNIIYTNARGTWMGNRGRLHDDRKKIMHPFKFKAWITCLLEFNERKREVMAQNRYTELFFMDEATAFAAGHRPCFECRRKDFNRFKSYWLKGNPGYGFDENVSIQKIDAILHQERINKNGDKITYDNQLKNLSDGSFILFKDKCYLFANHFLYEWAPAGYTLKIVLPMEAIVTVLTPRSVVNAFHAGYQPQYQISQDT